MYCSQNRTLYLGGTSSSIDYDILHVENNERYVMFEDYLTSNYIFSHSYKLQIHFGGTLTQIPNTNQGKLWVVKSEQGNYGTRFPEEPNFQSRINKRQKRQTSGPGQSISINVRILLNMSFGIWLCKWCVYIYLHVQSTACEHAKVVN